MLAALGTGLFPCWGNNNTWPEQSRIPWQTVSEQLIRGARPPFLVCLLVNSGRSLARSSEQEPVFLPLEHSSHPRYRKTKLACVSSHHSRGQIMLSKPWLYINHHGGSLAGTCRTANLVSSNSFLVMIKF